MPYYYALRATGHSFFPRVDDAGINYWQTNATEHGTLDLVINALNGLKTSFLHFVHQPDMRAGWLYYGGEHPLVLTWFVPLLLLGVGYAVWRWRSRGMLLLALWIMGTGVSIGFIKGPGTSIRFPVVHAAVALAMAVAVLYGVSLLLDRYSHRSRSVILGALITIVVVGQGAYFIGDHIPTYNRQLRELFGGCGGGTDATLRAAELPAHTRVYTISLGSQCNGFIENNLIWFMRDDIKVYIPWQRDDITDEFLETQVPRHVDVAFFLWPQDTEMRDRLYRHFRVDEPQTSPYPEPEPGITFLMYFIHAEPQTGPGYRFTRE